MITSEPFPLGPAPWWLPLFALAALICWLMLAYLGMGLAFRIGDTQRRYRSTARDKAREALSFALVVVTGLISAAGAVGLAALTVISSLSIIVG